MSKEPKIVFSKRAIRDLEKIAKEKGKTLDEAKEHFAKSVKIPHRDPICHDCKVELLFKTTIHTLDITMTEERWIRIWFCPKCGQRYQKNANNSYVKGIGKEEIYK